MPASSLFLITSGLAGHSHNERSGIFDFDWSTWILQS